MARWDDEELYSISPSENIVCKDCANRLLDTKAVKDRYKFGICDEYEVKPHGVLWENARCNYYRKEERQ